MKPGRHYIGLGVGAVIFNSKGEILLMKRTQTTKDHRTTVGMWSVPGGEVEFSETCETAVKRETKEELGIDIKIIKLIGFTDQILPKSRIHWHSMHFLCKIVSAKGRSSSGRKGTPKNKEPEKFDDIKWFSPKKLPKNSGFTHVIRPLFLLGKISKSEYNKRIKSTPES